MAEAKKEGESGGSYVQSLIYYWTLFGTRKPRSKIARKVKSEQQSGAAPQQPRDDAGDDDEPMGLEGITGEQPRNSLECTVRDSLPGKAGEEAERKDEAATKDSTNENTHGKQGSALFMPEVVTSEGLSASQVSLHGEEADDAGAVYDDINDCDDTMDPLSMTWQKEGWDGVAGRKNGNAAGVAGPRRRRHAGLSKNSTSNVFSGLGGIDAPIDEVSADEEKDETDGAKAEDLEAPAEPTPPVTPVAVRFVSPTAAVRTSKGQGHNHGNYNDNNQLFMAEETIMVPSPDAGEGPASPDVSSPRSASRRALEDIEAEVANHRLSMRNSISKSKWGVNDATKKFFATLNLRRFQEALSSDKEVIGKRLPAHGRDRRMSWRMSKKDLSGGDKRRISESAVRAALTATAAAKPFSAPDPAQLIRNKTAYYIWFFCTLNIALMIYYLTWRFNTTFPANMGKLSGPYDNFKFWWWWLFFIVELWLSCGIVLGHSMRLFPINRVKVTMDQLVALDQTVAFNSRISVMIPTAGEKLEVVLKAILGAMSQRLWESELSPAQAYRILILDEKRRPDVYQLVCWVYTMAQLIAKDDVQNILMGEGLGRVTPRAFYEWCTVKGGFARRHLYNKKALNKAIMLVRRIDALIFLNEASGVNPHVVFVSEDPEELGMERGPHFSQLGGEITVTRKDLVAANDACPEEGLDKISPGFFRMFSSCETIPILIYYSRMHSGTPKCSPKAGNMNAAIFPVDYPDQRPFIGSSTVVMVNDCRHQLEDECLQRTVPYFFKLHQDDKKDLGSSDHHVPHATISYKWSDVGFVQIPQRFRPTSALKQANDPLGNESAILFEIINQGKDGVGAVSSSGQGSLWRVAALHGMEPNGAYSGKGYDASDVGHTLGFRAEMLIEDTHTSIDMFRLGWKSAYVNEENEVLAWCTHQPDNIKWRMKQVLRWHQGACQALLTQSLLRNLFTGKFPTIWHRIYIIDQTTYFLQAFPGYALTMMPLIYAASGHPPFRAMIGDYFVRFVPVILTSMIPTTIASTWRNVDTIKLTRDEQVWLSTCYIQIYALLQTVWQTITCAGMENAWTVSAPIYPLYLAFMAQFVAVAVAAWRMYDDKDFIAHFIAVFASAALVVSSLWPMVSLLKGWRMPSAYYMKMIVWACVGIAALIVSHLPNDPTA